MLEDEKDVEIDDVVDLNTVIRLTQIGHKQLREVTLGRLTLWFSYETLVAFRLSPGPLQVSENQWTSTTDKHLSYIDPRKKDRLASDEFELKVWEVLAQLGL